MQKIPIGLFVLIATNVALVSAEPKNKTFNEKCHKLGILIYEEMGCNPIRDKPDQECPTSYNCNHIYSQWPTYEHCLFQGVNYKRTDAIPFNLTEQSCHINCICMSWGNTDAIMICSPMECADGIGPHDIPTDARYTYTLGGCCATGHIYPPFVNLPYCEVDNQTYYKGEKFYTQSACVECVCKKDFQGKYVEPYCIKSSCGIELRHYTYIRKFCAPVFDTASHRLPCCPTLFTCAENNIMSRNDLAPPPFNVCKYGSNLFEIGHSFTKPHSSSGKSYTISCKCQIPPLFTCWMEKIEECTEDSNESLTSTVKKT